MDLRAAELRKHGVKIRLQEQPFRILAMLLAHPGEVVLREEIRRKLWPNDTIVEFGHGINAAVQRLREALGESAEKPQHIETLTRQSYRFLGEVEVVEREPPAAEPAPKACERTA
ncbi:MAG TPA: winged helix-turn-helix domain-containing protein, partial [Bryobacteraceae bacterium]